MKRNHHIVVIRMNGPGGQSVRCLDSERFTIGRVGTDFLVADKGVSRTHLTVLVRGRDVWLQDMGSANGTYVGESRLQSQSPQQYEPGLPVRLGVCKDLLTFELVERVLTLSESEADAAELQNSPSKALPLAPTDEESRQKADAFLKEARGAAVTIKEMAGREAQDMLARARAEAETILSQAQSMASESVISRENAATEMLAAARKEASRLKAQAEEDAEQIAKDSRIAIAQVKLNAQKEAEEILRAAREKATGIKERAENENLELLREAREKSRTLLEKTETEIEQTLQEARTTAAQIRAEAEAHMDRAESYVHEKGDGHLKETREFAARIRAEAEAESKRVRELALSEAARIRDEARAEGLRAKEHGLVEAQHEVDLAKDGARKEIQALQETRDRLNMEIAEVRRQAEAHMKEADARREESEATHMEVEKLRAMLESAAAERDRAKVEMAAARDMKEQAEQERDQALKVKREAEAEAENVRKEASEQKGSLARELKDMNEKNLMEFEDRKKEQESEIAKAKLKWLEELKARQFEEKKQERVLKMHHATEVARQLEMMIIPMVQAQVPGADTGKLLEQIKTEFEPVVRKVILDEGKEATNSEIEQVISADPIIEKMRKKERFRLAAGFAAPTLIALYATFSPESFAWLRNIDQVFAGKSNMEIIAAERAIASAKKAFTPTLVDELGKTYTDSVLYTRLYGDRKMNERLQAKWTTELETFLYKELGVPEQVAVGFVATESTLIDSLLKMRNDLTANNSETGIKKMRELEEQILPELKGKVGGDVTFDRIREFEKKFLAENSGGKSEEGSGPAPASTDKK